MISISGVLVVAPDEPSFEQIRAEGFEGVPPWVVIRADQLEKRKSELPAPRAPVYVLDQQSAAFRGVQILRALGRQPILLSLEEARSVRIPMQGPRLWSPSRSCLELNQRAASTAQRVLDLGCGGGRDSVFLAKMGMSVVGVDRNGNALKDALRLASLYLREESQTIEWVEANVQDWSPQEKFPLILSVYAFEPSVIRRASQWLLPGGLLFIETFSDRHFRCFGRPSLSKCPKIEEIDRILPCLNRIEEESFWTRDRHALRVVYRAV